MELLKESTKKYWEVTRPYHAIIFFAAGFLFDILTLEEVDDMLTLVSQFMYLIVALGLFLLTSEGKGLSHILPSHSWAQKISEFEEDIFHFALGALLNAFTLYFFKSGTFLNSLIFLFFLSGLLLLNEFRPPFLKHDLIPAMLIHTCILSFSVILAPTLIGKMGTIPFAIGILIYLALVALWLKLRKDRLTIKPQIMIASGLSVFFLALYLFRIFPPVPLSLKKIGVYHKVEKVIMDGDTRYLTFTSSPWWKFWSDTSAPFQARPSDTPYVFTRIFAPGGFADTVYIEWWWLGPKDWIRTDRIPLTITGGRRDGFRGFAFKRNFDAGAWKVLITTSDGLEIGRTVFDIEKVPAETEITLNTHKF